jgi:hypothetical protein
MANAVLAQIARIEIDRPGSPIENRHDIERTQPEHQIRDHVEVRVRFDRADAFANDQTES